MAAAVPAASQQPLLTYWDRTPPYAAIALAQEAKVDLQHAADPKATKETVATLQFSNGCVAGRCRRYIDVFHVLPVICDSCNQPEVTALHGRGCRSSRTDQI